MTKPNVFLEDLSPIGNKPAQLANVQKAHMQHVIFIGNPQIGKVREGRALTVTR